MKTQTEYGGLTPKSGTSWLMSYQSTSPQNGTTGKVTGRMTARKESSLQPTKKTARPLTENGFIWVEAQSWSDSKAAKATKHTKMTSNIISAILSLVYLEVGVIAIYLLSKLTGQKERFIVLNVHYLAAYVRGLFPITIGAVLVAFVIWLIG